MKSNASEVRAETEWVEAAKVLVPMIAWVVMYFSVRAFLEMNPDLSSEWRLAVSFVPTPVFALFLWNAIKALRGADELEQRIQLEALALAFPLGMLLLSTLALVQRAVELNFQDWSYGHVWPMFYLFYMLGLVLARRRYA